MTLPAQVTSSTPAEFLAQEMKWGQAEAANSLPFIHLRARVKMYPCLLKASTPASPSVVFHSTLRSQDPW